MSYSPSNGVLRLLLAVKFSLCHSDHIRNICNQQYCKECITPLVRSIFSFVRDVAVVHSDDVDLVSIVEKNGGQVTTPYLTFIVHSLTYLQIFCLDLHPEIDDYMKIISPMEYNDDLSYGSSEDGTTRYAFANRSHMCWGIVDATTIIGRNGLVFSGVNEILNNRDNFPDRLDIVEDPTKLCRFLSCKCAASLPNELYKRMQF